METQDLSRPQLMRRVIVDMLPYEIPDVDLLMMQDRLGLVPSSPDVLVLDRKESEARIRGLTPISSTITLMSGMSAEAIAEYFLMQLALAHATNDDDVDDEGISEEHLRNVLIRQNMNVIVTAAHGIVSHLIASGILVLNKDKIT
jgi:hypothetical protein